MIGTHPTQELYNLTEAIGKRPGKSDARKFLEVSSILSQGAATIGRFLWTHWGVERILQYAGLGVTSSFYTSVGVAAVDVVMRAASEWYIQKETATSVRSCGSRAESYWPLRWAYNIVSSPNSLFFSLPIVGVIFKELGDSTPLYVKVIIAAVTVPAEFTSFFHFLREGYGNILTEATTIRPTTVQQKRAWLTKHIERARMFNKEADGETTDFIIIHSQGGI